MLLPIVAVFSWWLFDESLDRWTLLGAGIIFAANAYIAHREATLAKRAATESPISAAKPKGDGFEEIQRDARSSIPLLARRQLRKNE